MPSGVYLIDRFVIVLDANSHSFDVPNGVWLPFAPRRTSIFFHEYSHYLQNTSTLYGFSDFHTELDLWWLFRETVDRTTLESVGSGQLPVAKQGWIALYQALRQTVSGSLDPTGGPLPNTIQFTITNVQVKNVQLPLPGGPTTRSHLTIDGTAMDGNSLAVTQVQFEFGTDALHEGLAAILQDAVSVGLGGQALSLSVFPYEVLRSLAAHVAGFIDDQSLAMLATLSLQSNNPPLELHNLLTQWAADPDVPNRLSNIVQTEVPHTSQKIGHILATDIPRLRGVFAGKGAIGKGIEIVLDCFEDALNHRLSNPFFDIDVAFSPQPITLALGQLFNRHLPCLVLQKNANNAPDDMMEFGPVANSSELSALHGAFEFFAAHLAGAAFIGTGQIQNQECPFYSCCSLPLRAGQPQTCQSEPWRSPFWPGHIGAPACWYAHGVRSSAV